MKVTKHKQYGLCKIMRYNKDNTVILRQGCFLITNYPKQKALKNLIKPYLCRKGNDNE